MNHLSIDLTTRDLVFRQPAGTSRGVYTTRRVYYLGLRSSDYPDRIGLGECAPLPKLSCDAYPDYENRLSQIVLSIEQTGTYPMAEALIDYPSIRFGLETARRHLERGDWALWDTPFARGERGIQINGLIWMGQYDQMLSRIEEKLKAGYRCIKMKIGGIDWADELALLRYIRQHFSAQEVELRVDANGAFAPEIALERLKQLADLELHSIEQPIGAGQREALAQLCAQTPLPIALDEELIGYNEVSDKRQLLSSIRPHYLVLKPSLHGGFSGSDEWIALAQEYQIGWWVTSALESNIGLNAIAQWCARYDNSLAQGLGTGQLFVDNIELPLEIRHDALWYRP